MYPNARVYNEGIVRKQTHDHHGYPMIFVEWDKDHWSYSGEEDRWVLEAHFDPVEGNMEDNRNNDLAAALGKFLQDWQSGQKSEPEPKEDNRPQDELGYDEVLELAAKDARNGEAFIVIVASPESFQGTDLVVPHIYIDSKNDDAALVLEATAADYVAQSMGRLVQELVRSRHESGS